MKRHRAIISAALISSLVVTSLVIQPPQYQQIRESWRGRFQSKQQDFDEIQWGFQFDMPSYSLPSFDHDLVKAEPMNWKGSGHDTYATFYASRNASMKEPYFLAAQQIVYRILWSQQSRSKHAMTVFVAPFVSQEQRDFFSGAGAIVKELPIRPFIPEHPGAAGRLKDMFSKLEMWNHTEYKRIIYLDSDAFPLANIDALFDLAKEQQCQQDLLPEADAPFSDAICRYTFAAHHDFMSINAGVMVFSPNEPMYRRLTRESRDQSKFDNGFMEQALLNLAYSPDGPFPASSFPHAYNGGVDVKEHGEELFVAHHKLWNTQWDSDEAWYKNVFSETWSEMLQFYDSTEFRALRLGKLWARWWYWF